MDHHTRLRAPPSLFTPNSWSNLLSLNQPHSFSISSPKPISRISLHKSVFISSKTTEEERTDNFTKLKQKIETLGVNSDSCTPGFYDLLYCPMCKGGEPVRRSLSFHINVNWNYAIWRCFNEECGWAGQVFADARKVYPGVNLRKRSSARLLAGESPRLQALDDQVLAYFAERMISKETLERNHVMQAAGDRKIIAFTYRRNGEHVGCKYRTIEKRRFWQEKNTDKMLYGLDDIADADEIIIVEGELDKLSFEEAGFRNCVSVPSGAPQTVSVKDLPSLDKDISFKYFWNCKDYLDKASRIILATDSDLPGQALAEELSRRLGRERCWIVRWPKKDESSYFKDANEVLMNLGSDAIRDAIDNAEMYDVQNSEFIHYVKNESGEGPDPCSSTML